MSVNVFKCIRMNKLLTLTFVFVFGTNGNAYSQDQAFLDAQLKETKKKHATFTRIMTHIGDSVFVARVTDLEGNLKIEGAYVVSDGKVIENGKFTFYHQNGKIESQGMYEMGVKVGTWKRFMQNGTAKTDRYYDPKSATMIRAVMGS